MSKLPQSMREINIFVDAIGHLGTSEEFELPKINQKKFSQEFGGFEREVLTGSFEKRQVYQFCTKNNDVGDCIAGTSCDDGSVY